jgi:hypothetical protein
MLTLNTSSHYTWLANREAVRVYNRLGVALGTVPDAKRLMQGLGERARSGGTYIGTSIDWRLPRVQILAAISPGCFIVDGDGIAYTVVAVDPPGTYRGTWNCRCVALMVVGSTITWHLPVRAVDAYGSPNINQASTLATTAAGINEQLCEEVNFQGIVTGFRRTYAIWVLGDVALEVGCVGVDQAGKVYTVKAVHNRTKLDELLMVEAVVEP